MTEKEHGSVAMGDSTFEAPQTFYVRWALGDDGSLRIRKWSQFPFDGATDYAAALSRPEQEPALYVSAEQLPMLPEHGYFPARNKPEGKFQTPLYAAPQPAHGTSATERAPLMEEPVGKQWCVYEDGEQRTSWYYVGQREGDAPGWEKAQSTFPDIYQIKTRLLYAGPVVEDAE